MSQYAVVYWSGTGNTEAMANAVVEGINGTGNEGKLISCSDFTEGDVATFDGIAFGCSASGAEALEESEFEPMWDNVLSALKGKKVVLFGSYGWGGGEYLTPWQSKGEEAGASVLDTFVCENAPDDDALEACKKLGKLLAD